MKIEFKVFYNNRPATHEELDQIEEIVVEQEVGKVWEARVKIPVGVSDAGVWEGEREKTRREFSRVRVAVRAGESGFLPLIDGTVVGQDWERSAVPGASFLTLIVHDDSSLLHRKQATKPLPEETDSQIARRLFREAGLVPDVDETRARPVAQRPVLQKDTPIEMLRQLAKRNGDFYSYVLPGENAGKSVGCFKRLPTGRDKKLPPLKMFGADRNLAEFNVRHNALAGRDVEAAALSLRDKKLTNHVFKYRQIEMIGKKAATEFSEENQTKRRLPPGHSDAVNGDEAVKGEAEKAAYALSAEGSVLPLCYEGVLSPYRMVSVCLSESFYSTDYIVFRVVHSLNRSNYTQSFSMKARAIASEKEAIERQPQSSAPADAPFNAQGKIV